MQSLTKHHYQDLRPAWDKLLLKVFPGAKPHRRELEHCWKDTIDLSYFRVEFQVYHANIGKKQKPGMVDTSIRAVRKSVDGSDVIIHFFNTPVAEEALKKARAHIMGMAASIHLICGTYDPVQDGPLTSPLLQDPEEEDLDMDGLFSDSEMLEP